MKNEKQDRRKLCKDATVSIFEYKSIKPWNKTVKSNSRRCSPTLRACVASGSLSNYSPFSLDFVGENRIILRRFRIDAKCEPNEANESGFKYFVDSEIRRRKMRLICSFTFLEMKGTSGGSGGSGNAKIPLFSTVLLGKS